MWVLLGTFGVVEVWLMKFNVAERNVKLIELVNGKYFENIKANYKIIMREKA